MNTPFKLSFLPPKKELETPQILKQLAKSHRHLAELKGTVKTIPNENILINILRLYVFDYQKIKLMLITF